MKNQTSNLNNTPKPKFKVDQEIDFDSTRKFDYSKYDVISGKVITCEWDSDKQTWLYHIELVKHGEKYKMLFVRGKYLRKRKDFYEYHKKREES